MSSNKRLSRLKRFPVALIRDFSHGRMNLYAMSLAYIMLLSLVPLLALSFSVLQGFGVHNQLEPLLLNLLAPLGERANQISAQLLEFVSNMKIGVLGAVGLGMLLYTVFSLMQKLVGSINYTWNTRHGRPIRQRITDYFALLLIGPVLMFSVAGATTTALELPFLQSILEVELISQALRFLIIWLPMILIVLALSFIYWFLPGVRVRWYAALSGGLIAGLLWKLLGLGFAVFTVSSTKYTAIYSAFATLLLLLIWMYLSFLTLLLGSRIAYYIQFPASLDGVGKDDSAYVNGYLGLKFLYKILAAFQSGEGAVSIRELSVDANESTQQVTATLQRLEKSGLIVPVDTVEPAYLLARAPETIRLAEVLRILQTAGLPEEGRDAAADIIHRERRAVDRDLDTATLKQWFDDDMKLNGTFRE